MNYKKGLSFVEMVVILAIIGILASIIVSVVSRALGRKVALVNTADACGFLTSCGPDTNSQNTFTKEAAVTEVNQRQLLNSTAIPTFQNSQERENLVRRLNTFNTPNKISYIYLVSYGRVMAFYTVKGKVSSVDSLLTNPTQLVDRYGDQCSGSNSQDCFTVPSPDLDGSYGTNGNGIFFYDTAGAYHEWNGEYLLVDQPQNLATQPDIVQVIKK